MGRLRPARAHPPAGPADPRRGRRDRARRRRRRADEPGAAARLNTRAGRRRGGDSPGQQPGPRVAGHRHRVADDDPVRRGRAGRPQCTGRRNRAGDLDAAGGAVPAGPHRHRHPGRPHAVRRTGLRRLERPRHRPAGGVTRDRGVGARSPSALSDARLPAGGTAVRVRWTGTVNDAPAALFTNQPPGAGCWRTRCTVRRTASGRICGAPAGGRGRHPADRLADAGRGPRRPDRSGACGGAARFGTGGDRAGRRRADPGPLDADGTGTASLPPGAAATVEVRDARGATWSSPVIPFETDSGGIPGDTPKTRIVG